ncbi:Periplasmic serine endoprotease DegP precursor [Botrimarina colliarenosi]|uniref:Periplasmic serine endoprotease DegP n=1 Tax=Botrimarina colliarenosi TaxID=2528001 RepID=A0A5C6ABB6_9BACT|nr:PDZ domain-containing protein [Botrimarina colliarenosi]TWT96700.1 Periplasmic serine endoprotease DegP precursor [Botrimarina colliarenosi]
MRVLGLLVVAAAALTAVQFVSPAVRAQDSAPTNGAPADGAVADDAPAAEEGTLIQIGPDGGVRVEVDGAARRDRRPGRRLGRQPGFVEAPQVVSRYWIGIGGGPLPAELRAQLQIDANEGWLIRTVEPDGPAAEAGVKQFDILLRANGKPVSDISQLAEEVGEQGELQGRITLDLLRGGQPQTLWVKPIERPLDAVLPAEPRRERFGFFGRDGREGLFGPGGLLDGDGLPRGEGGLGEFAEMIPQVVSGVSVSVSRQNDGPAKVTVTRGEQTWEFDEGDQDAIATLPGDVRPMVERMLQQNGGVFQPGFEGFGLNTPGFQMQLEGPEARVMQERMRAMQERMRALQQQFGAPPAGPGAPMIEPQIELDEAPAFNAEAPPEPKPEVEGPTELEIPANTEE